jgi:glycosyltransferase involved in cell wall biosynthesis
MKILLVHQNFPGQFKHLAPMLLQEPRNEVVAFTMNDYQGPATLKVVRYQAAKGTSKDVHPWVAETETKVIRGDAAFRAALALKHSGFDPDLILAHPGWGESLFLKQVWPKSKMVIYCEFFYAAQGSDVGFDPEFASTEPGDACRVRMKNVNNLLHFDIADGGISPTEWQKSTFPEPFRSKIDVVHDGVNTELLRPNPDAWLQFNQKKIGRGDEIITFVNRNLEPYRGYHTFMRALPAILKARPNARVLIVGGDGVSYGAKAPDGHTWKQIYLDEVKHEIDLTRVHFLGHIPYQHFITLLQISTVHVYFTYPFVLSWSLLEAMSCGCSIVASDTKPLHEAIIHNQTGMLTSFFDPKQLSQQVIELLNSPSKRQALGHHARALAIQNFDLTQVSLPRLLSIIERYR